MAKPQKPQDAFVANGWYLNLPVAGILSNGLFETLEGMGKSSGNVEMVDAGSNHVYNLTDQLTRYDEMTLTRTYQGNAADRAMEALVSTMIETGMKLPKKIVVYGSFQSHVGAVKNDSNSELTRMYYIGDNTYTLSVVIPFAGTYDYSISTYGTLSATYQADGYPRSGSSNKAYFTTRKDNTVVRFRYQFISNKVTIEMFE